MKKTVISYGTQETPFASRCWDTQRRYAERVGAEFVRVLIQPESYPHQRKLRVIKQNCTEGRVCYFDWDVEILDNAEDVFALPERFYMFHDPANDTGNGGMLLGDYVDFMRMHNVFRTELSRQLRVAYNREELAMLASAKLLGLGMVPYDPEGMIHHIGFEKYEEQSVCNK